MSSALKTVLPRALQSHDQSERLEALQALKNDIVGHVQKKEQWLEASVLEPIVKSLDFSNSSTGHHRRASSLSAEEDVRLQALQVLSSFAKGGFAFLAPLHAAGALNGILSSISPNQNPSQVVVAALRAALNIAEATLLAPHTCSLELSNLADLVLVPTLLEAFRDILSGSVTSHRVQMQRNLVAKLVSLLCTEDRHQHNLADSGILDALATNLASVIVARGFAIPGAEAAAQNDGILDLFPAAAAPGTDVTAILEALSAIIGDSRWRASALVHSPAILVIFPNLGLVHQSKAITACANAFDTTANSTHPHINRPVGVMDSFLPVIPEAQQLFSPISPFVPLGNSSSKDAPSNIWNHSPFTWDTASNDPRTPAHLEDNTESPLIPWLIHTARASSGMERLMAASVVTSLFKAGHGNPSRESYMGRLLVPILLQGLEDRNVAEIDGEGPLDDAETATYRFIVERSLAVLAKLVVDSEFLQKCAFECSAVRIISFFLQLAYEPVSSNPTRPWSPTPQPEKVGQKEAGTLASRLGPPGQVPLLAHRIRVREAALKAVAALAGKDEYSKIFVEQNLVPYIVESLSAKPSKPTKDGPKSPKIRLGRDDGTDFDPAYGANPVSVIVAACHALRTLSRSVSILRTTLQDCGVVHPAFRLLRHANIEVQIAASGLMCNLVTNVSPMKIQLDTVGVMRVLCEQTRSESPVLRLNALWALKHWISGASLQAKKECLEELTPGWLIQLIHEDKEDDALYQRMTRIEKQATNDGDEDVEMAQPGETSRTSIRALLQSPATTQPNNAFTRTTRHQQAVERSTATVQPIHASAHHTPRLQQAAVKIAESRENELNPVRKVRDDDLAIQEQGLKFLQNLLGHIDSPSGSVKEHAEMIEHLFTVLDSSRFFEILESKLRPKFMHPFGRRHSSGPQDSRVLYPQARILAPVVYILVHMAASIPKHRQILTSQDKLLASLSRHFGSKDKDVRVALCHLMSNLTWADDEDENQSRERAGELKRLGLLGKLETLESEDPDLNVRERAKAAIWQIKKPRGF
ncbi:unnamed protein product [Discula destructiva]